MRKLLGLAGAAAVRHALAASAAQAGEVQAERHQPDVRDLRLAADHGRGDERASSTSWNKTHPSIQVSIVPVDVNSVHDKLLTSFVGGTAADIIHDEAADIPGFTQQGYLANLTPLIPKEPEGRDPEVGVGHVNFGHDRITGVPIMLQTYNVFANMDLLKAAGIKAPTVTQAVDVGPVPRRREEAHRRTATTASAGASARRPRTIQTISLNWGGQWNYLAEAASGCSTSARLSRRR